MELKLLKLTNLTTLLFVVLALIVRYQFAIGLLCGQLFFDIYFLLLTKSMDRKLTNSKRDIWTIIQKITRILLLGLPLLLGFLFPTIMDVSGCFVGLIIFKIVTLIYALREKK